MTGGSASFGWIISTRSGDPIAALEMGPLPGKKVRLCRAKACGILSFLRLLIQSCGKFTQLHEQWRKVLTTNSQRLLDMMFGRDHGDRADNTHMDLSTSG